MNKPIPEGAKRHLNTAALLIESIKESIPNAEFYVFPPPEDSYTAMQRRIKQARQELLKFSQALIEWQTGAAK